ncbi:MAG: hypothetical protein J6N73_00410 [Prevotella sp.]|nr:hypothetical protein [Prevotella sp.]
MGGANAKHDVPSDDANDVLPSVMDVWYTLDGRRIGGKPATKGLYINKGRLIVIP